MTGAHTPQDCLYFHLFLVIVLLLFFCFSSFQSKSHLSQTLCCFAVRSCLPVEPGSCEYERSPCLCLSIFQYAGRLPSWFLLGCCGRLGKAEAAAGRPRPCTARAITHSMDAFPIHTVWPSHPYTTGFCSPEAALANQRCVSHVGWASGKYGLVYPLPLSHASFL